MAATAVASRLPALVGKKVSAALVDGTSFEADLFAFDASSGVCIFRQQYAHTFMKADYRVVPVGSLTGVDALGDGTVLPALRAITEKETRERLVAAMAAEELKLASRGVGVSSEAQALYDHLAKFYNPRDVCWVGKSIVLFGAVVVQDPYGPRNVGVLDVDPVKKTRVDKATYTGTADQVKAQIEKHQAAVAAAAAAAGAVTGGAAASGGTA